MNEKLNPTIFITFMVLYFGACASIWHLTFWSNFDINFLQFIDITKIIKDFAYPFLSSCAVFTITFIASSLFHVFENVNYSRAEFVKDEKVELFKTESSIYGRGRNSSVGEFLNKNVKIFALIYCFFVFSVGKWGNDSKWTILPLMISPPIAILLTNRNIFFKRIQNLDIRFSLLNFIIILPLISYFYSMKASLDIYNNASYKVISNIKLKSDDIKAVSKIFIGKKYLGAGNDKLFLIDLQNNEITIINTEEVVFVSYIKKKKDNL